MQLSSAQRTQTMNLYLAAVYTNSYMPTQQRFEKLNDCEREIVTRIPNILESYHYVKNQRFVDTMRQQGAKVFLDSGAFSAYSLGVNISIDDYCQYIIRNRDILRVDGEAVMASVLDGIGDALKTWQNQLYMESQGAKPLPCFHYGEDPQYLDWYVERYEYITIGGLVGRAQQDQEMWLDRVWNDHMIDGSGRAKLKVHAFGMTAPSLMKRYPWHSVDSSSWIQAAAFGSVFTNEHGPISVSDKSPSRQDKGRHLTTLTAIERASVEAMLNSKGFNFERLSTIYESRACYNTLGYMELNDTINAHIEQSKGIFSCYEKQELF
jgi:hypothetical protein